MPKNDPPVAPEPAPKLPISARFAKALISVGKVVKDETNPRFKKGYASLNATLDVVRPVLEALELVISQKPDYDPVTQMASVQTTLYDLEGDTLDLGICHMPLERVDPQAFGGGISYLRRYTVNCIFNLQVEDDDGEGSTFRTPAHKAPRSQERSLPTIPGARSAHENEDIPPDEPENPRTKLSPARPPEEGRSGPRPPGVAPAPTGKGLAGSNIQGLKRKPAPTSDNDGAGPDELPEPEGGMDAWQLEDLKKVPTISGKLLGSASKAQLQQLAGMGDDYIQHARNKAADDPVEQDKAAAIALRALTAAKLLLKAMSPAEEPDEIPGL